VSKYDKLARWDATTVAGVLRNTADDYLDKMTKGVPMTIGEHSEYYAEFMLAVQFVTTLYISVLRKPMEEKEEMVRKIFDSCKNFCVEAVGECEWLRVEYQLKDLFPNNL
jgi:hypothetical protein